MYMAQPLYHELADALVKTGIATAEQGEALKREFNRLATQEEEASREAYVAARRERAQRPWWKKAF